MRSLNALRAVRISLASPEDIRTWSYGEVTLPETIHFRTHKPVVGGLFCERIFGPTRDWSCACGRYQRQRKPGTVCEHCGVELAPATVRRERMGHIELAAPVVHPWYLRDRSICHLLDLSLRQLRAVLSAQRYLVLSVKEEERTLACADQQTEPQEKALLSCVQPGDLLDEASYRTLRVSFPTIVSAKTGAEAIRERLSTLDLDRLVSQLRITIATSGRDRKKAIRREAVVEAFRTSEQNPAWMVFSVLPVLPPELRPVLLLGGRVASSDVNELYCRVLHRNRRLKHFLAQGAPDIILHQERRQLQAACEALLDNAHATKRLTNTRRQPLKSLTDALEGKEGRFRRNLLGKRVDYSGRSVIVAGPQLKLHECGLPKAMACELFKPFLIRKLLMRRFAHSPRAAKRMVERRDEGIWDLLEEVLFERCVLLNRAPTLHRLSIQAFEPRLVEGDAIQLHPLVCSAFNADFDGDQMAVHVPLSEAAQQEARQLLLSTRNLRHPASGDPVMSPSQEMVLGCFYLTEDRPSHKQATHVFSQSNEVLLSHALGHLDLHSRVVVRTNALHLYDTAPPSKPRPLTRGRLETTVGRLLFNEILPAALGYRNYPMSKEGLKALVAECLATCGRQATVQLLDAMKRLGYEYATRSGISFAISDITMPPEREILIGQGRSLVQELDAAYHAGEITNEEWYQQVIAIWSQITEEISGKLKDVLDPYGTIMTIVKSGATKAKFQQIRQLSGIRGLMASPSGRILPIPVLSNYLLGLLTWEIFIAASGARKGFMDRSLNTAMSGYLTRRLVEAGMEVLVTGEDCQTGEGLLITQQESQRLGLASMRSRIIGRILAEPVGTLAAGTLLDEPLADALLERSIASVRVRSPLLCQASYGICQKCYGSDLATGQLAQMGAAVGVIAGQAIGEPGTQLTMRTFHSGGIAHNASDITLGLPRVNDLFEVRVSTQAALLAEHDGIVHTTQTDPVTGAHRLHITESEKSQPATWTCEIPFGRRITVTVGQHITWGTPLCEGPLDPQAVLQLLGQEAAARTLINEVQHVYRATGAVIHDKHLEVIVRQMSRYVQIQQEIGDTSLVPDQIIDRFLYLQHNANILAQGGRPALARPLLLGLTSAVLHTNSWIAAASFQQMSRVVAQAARLHQQDDLIGLKERLILGKKLPTFL